MKKVFNTTGLCIPEEHYMVDVKSKIAGIKEMIVQGKYFTINRARQYGKTTTMELLRRALLKEYVVVSLSFEDLGKASFVNENKFVREFLEYQLFPELELQDEDFTSLIGKYSRDLEDKSEIFSLARLSSVFTELCKSVDKPIVMMIDEVDSACNNQVFIDFLAVLRARYMKRSRVKTFQSVILASVYDVKNLKIKLHPEEESEYNSPWNIAADFEIDMSFSVIDIQTMLEEYKQEQKRKLDISRIAESLYKYTEGYPFLVSYICKVIDEEDLPWEDESIRLVIKKMLQGTNTLFDDIIKKLEQHERFRWIVERLLIEGEEIAFVRSNPDIDLGIRFGIFKNSDNKVKIANQIFEMYIYEYMISIRRSKDFHFSKYADKSIYVKDGVLNMDLIIERFAVFLKAEYRKENQDFIEQQGRLLFLCFIRPIINGTGHYSVEAETRQNNRMDVQIFYGSEEYIVELKIWHGLNYEQDAYEQLTKYLHARNQKKGYLLSFCRNQKQPIENRTFSYSDIEIAETIVMY